MNIVERVFFFIGFYQLKRINFDRNTVFVKIYYTFVSLSTNNEQRDYHYCHYYHYRTAGDE